RAERGVNEVAMFHQFPGERGPVLRRAALLAKLVSLAAFASACGAGDPTEVGRREPASGRGGESVGQTVQAVAGVDGNVTIEKAGTVVNAYTTLAADVATGATSISVGNVSALALGADALAPGDLLLIIQMQ